MKRILLALSLALLPSGALANDTWLEYIDWIVANTDYEYNGEPLPTVEERSQAELKIMAYGAEVVARAEFDGQELPDVLAAYDDFVMYVPVDTEVQPWVIVHELVHYLQEVNGALDECVGANEPEAYLLHDQWQEEHGYDEFRNSGNIMYGMMLGMTCIEQDMYGRPWPD